MHPLLPQQELVEYCQQRGIMVEGYSPLGSTDSPLLRDVEILEIARNHRATAGQVLLSWQGISFPPSPLHTTTLRPFYPTSFCPQGLPVNSCPRNYPPPKISLPHPTRRKLHAHPTDSGGNEDVEYLCTTTWWGEEIN